MYAIDIRKVSIILKFTNNFFFALFFFLQKFPVGGGPSSGWGDMWVTTFRTQSYFLTHEGSNIKNRYLKEQSHKIFDHWLVFCTIGAIELGQDFIS